MSRNRLVASKCIPVLLYGLVACPLNKTQLSSLDFLMNRFRMKLFSTSNMEIITYRREQFDLELPSVTLARHTTVYFWINCVIATTYVIKNVMRTWLICSVLISFICSHILLIIHYKASFSCERLVCCFRFVYIYACIVWFFVLLPFLGEKKINTSLFHTCRPTNRLAEKRFSARLFDILSLRLDKKIRNLSTNELLKIGLYLYSTWRKRRPVYSFCL